MLACNNSIVYKQNDFSVPDPGNFGTDPDSRKRTSD
jgi:hypothetical protein